MNEYQQLLEELRQPVGTANEDSPIIRLYKSVKQLFEIVFERAREAERELVCTPLSQGRIDFRNVFCYMSILLIDPSFDFVHSQVSHVRGLVDFKFSDAFGLEEHEEEELSDEDQATVNDVLSELTR